MQSIFTKEQHNKLREEAEVIEFKIPERPTLENPIFRVNEDYVHSLAGTIQMGAIGFDTFGMGSGHNTARGLWEAKNQLTVYFDEGQEYINSAAAVWEALDFKDPRAVIANSLYQIFIEYVGHGRSEYSPFNEEGFNEVLPIIRKVLRYFFKNVDDKQEYYHISTKTIKELFQKLTGTSSYYADCELVVEFITNGSSRTMYTANVDRDLTQDLHITVGENIEDNDLAGIYFHTGCDIRCGFSSPVFGVGYEYLTIEGFFDLMFPTVRYTSFYYPLEPEFGKSYRDEQLPEFFTEKCDYKAEDGKFLPDEDDGNTLIWVLKEEGLIEIEVSNRLGSSNFYLDREIKLTEKAIKIIRDNNPNPTKLQKVIRRIKNVRLPFKG